MFLARCGGRDVNAYCTFSKRIFVICVREGSVPVCLKSSLVSVHLPRERE